MEAELKGQEVAGWRLERRVGHGKSALVFRATRGDEVAAVKIFDRELVDRYGKEAQRERVMREKTLIGKRHPNLIQIYDAGEESAKELFFVVMEFFDGKNLDEVRVEVPIASIQPLLSQVAAAAHFLEQLGLAHRDIKPENIGVTADFSHAVLLDLGVVRPVGLSNVTDDSDQKTFVGTLRYSPPELLFREEQDSIEGWRAVTFYQLGGVLHDLITRRLLFADYSSPYARLVEAVKDVKPVISAPGMPPDLIVLAENCLIKSAASRLELVTWDAFQHIPSASNDTTAALERIARRRQAVASAPIRMSTAPTTRQRLIDLRNVLDTTIRDVCAASDLFPSLTLESHDPTDDHVCLRASFPRSPGLVVELPFVIYFDASIVDSEAGAIRVLVGGVSLEDGARCARQYEARALVACYEGVLRNESLRQRVRDSLIRGLDQAQSATQTNVWFDGEGGAHV